MNKIINYWCPPILVHAMRRVRMLPKKVARKESCSGQSLDVYWDSKMAELLETWGEGNVWNEIQFLMVNCGGRVLDIACGTGKTMELLSNFSSLSIYGCDISDFLISKAQERGIKSDRLLVCDATNTNYSDNYFAHAYSIGSLEHFTEDGIIKFISECHRITQKTSFHMVPVSRSDKDEGWLKTYQSFYNNSEEWWLNKFTAVYERVTVLDSVWNDEISRGAWFICNK